MFLEYGSTAVAVWRMVRRSRVYDPHILCAAHEDY
jgi:hypothetical protein